MSRVHGQQPQLCRAHRKAPAADASDDGQSPSHSEGPMHAHERVAINNCKPTCTAAKSTRRLICSLVPQHDTHRQRTAGAIPADRGPMIVMSYQVGLAGHLFPLPQARLVCCGASVTSLVHSLPSHKPLPSSRNLGEQAAVVNLRQEAWRRRGAGWCGGATEAGAASMTVTEASSNEARTLTSLPSGTSLATFASTLRPDALRRRFSSVVPILPSPSESSTAQSALATPPADDCGQGRWAGGQVGRWHSVSSCRRMLGAPHT